MSKVKENIVYVDKETMEIKSERTEFSKTFYVTDTERRLEASRSPLHVENKKGEWAEITCEIKGNKPINCPYKARMLKDRIGYSMERVVRDENDKETVHVTEMEIMDVPYTKPIIENNVAMWKNVTKGVDVVMTFTPQQVQMVRVVNNKSARKTFDYRIVVDEKVAENISFGGQDADGKAIHLEQKEKSSKSVKRKGLKLTEKIISDKFIPEVTEMDEVTRKRFWSKKVNFPVVIY